MRVGSRLLLKCGCKNGSVVFHQQNYPVRNVVSVPQLAFEVEVSAQKRCGHLGYQLFSRIGLGTKPAG
jgi:hypothetical protein